jgi:hypothetical protein
MTKHLETPPYTLSLRKQKNQWRKHTFHHLIALFCTVPANARRASPLATNFFNEIKDLEPILKQFLQRKTFKMKDLAHVVNVMPQG